MLEIDTAVRLAASVPVEEPSEHARGVKAVDGGNELVATFLDIHGDDFDAAQPHVAERVVINRPCCYALV
ncbi:hypothetical protein [Rhizobium sp. RAF56]|uniref:hypothetical protein n=1 Tax=Rhizobium sp. RAF56 TaxID=3233062 RepID=UPI003F9527BE